MKFQIYKAKDGTRWRCWSRNKRIIAESGEAYSRPSGCRKALKKFIADLRAAKYVFTEDDTQ